MTSLGTKLTGMVIAICTLAVPAFGRDNVAPGPRTPVAVLASMLPDAPYIPFDAMIDIAVSDADEECQEASRVRVDRRRFPWSWGFGWLYRYGVDREVERSSVTPFSHYLRSPLLSGLPERRPCNRGSSAEADEDCALVTLRSNADRAITLEVPLPQLEARNSRQLRTALTERLGRTDRVTLVTTDGEDYALQSGTVKEVEAKTCRD
jgi:hypothetical protein